jgi:hypothetical protein
MVPKTTIRAVAAATLVILITKPAINVRRSSCTATDIYVRFYRKSDLLHRFSATSVQNVTKIQPARDELLHTDGRTDVVELMVVFR